MKLKRFMIFGRPKVADERIPIRRHENPGCESQKNLCKTISSNVLLGWKVSAVIPVGSFGYYFELRSFRLMDEPRLSNKMGDQNETCYNHQRVEAQSALLSITIEGSVYG